MPSYFSSPASTSTTSTIEQEDLREDQRMLNALPPANRPFPLTSTCPRPIPNSYWAAPLLVACEYPWSPKSPNKPKVDALLRAGVRTFIDLTECGELVPYASILSDRATLLGIDPATLEYHRFPIRDRCLPNSVEDMYKVMAVLRDNEDRERISAVHCRGGIGRTGMVIGCWLVESGLAKNGEEALDAIAREWRTVEKCKRFPHSPETGPQFEFVLNFKAAPKTLRVIASEVSEAVCEVSAGVSTASAGRRQWIGALGFVAVLLTVRFTVMAGSLW